MVKYLLRFSYIGTPFSGVMRQSMLTTPTVADAIEHALSVMRPLQPKNIDQIRFRMSSRTDAGVHALCNAGLVDLEHIDAPEQEFNPDQLKFMMNRAFIGQKLPIRIKCVNKVDDRFNCRYHALSRKYLYRLAIVKEGNMPAQPPDKRREGLPHDFAAWKKTTAHDLPLFEHKRCLAISTPVDIPLMQEAAKLYVGTHDFKSFTTMEAVKAEVKTERTIYQYDVSPGRGLIEDFDPAYEKFHMLNFAIHGRSFIHKQIRHMTGALLAIGHGRLDIAGLRYLLENPSKDSWFRKQPPVLPPEGLYLQNVEYDENDFLNPRDVERPEEDDDDDVKETEDVEETDDDDNNKQQVQIASS